MRWLLLAFLAGCAGTKLHVGVKYDVMDQQIGATSQFFPSATASIDQEDVYGGWVAFEFPIGGEPEQRVRIENPLELQGRGPIVVDRGANAPAKGDVEAVSEAIGEWSIPTLALVGLFALVVVIVAGGVLKARAKKNGAVE